MSKQIIGIMGAMPKEVDSIVTLLTEQKEFMHGMRTYYTGKINGFDTVVVFSRWGKVAAATTVTTLILEFNITELIFTGVAGAINASLTIGDVVIGNRLIQHDMDASPLLRKYEVPLLDILYFESSKESTSRAFSAVHEFITNVHFEKLLGAENLKHFNISKPQLIVGDIASGDRFFSSLADKRALSKALEEVWCVEMEGAAVAQVCYED